MALEIHKINLVKSTYFSNLIWACKFFNDDCSKFVTESMRSKVSWFLIYRSSEKKFKSEKFILFWVFFCNILCHDNMIHTGTNMETYFKVEMKTLSLKYNPYKTNINNHQTLHEFIYQCRLFFCVTLWLKCNISVTTNTFNSDTSNIILAV